MRLVYEQFARDKYSSPPPLEGKGTVKAIHYIMSFADSENVTPELAFKIAKAFVKKNSERTRRQSSQLTLTAAMCIAM